MAQTKIGIIDYGMGNIRSVMNALNETGGSGSLLDDPDQLIKFDKIILPGVGAFGQAMRTLHQSGFIDALIEFQKSGKFILGICLGMQLLCKQSREDGIHQGLGWFDANVVPFPKGKNLCIPHMGWNDVEFAYQHPIINGIESGEDFYFVHSYYVDCKDKSDILGRSEYGNSFSSIIQKENVIGMQFHPEKSQRVGLQVVENFINK